MNIPLVVFLSNFVASSITLSVLLPSVSNPILLFPYVSFNVPCGISTLIFPLHSLYDFPVLIVASSKSDSVNTCVTSYFPVFELYVRVDEPSDLAMILVTSVPSINIFILLAVNELVTSLAYSLASTSGFVVPFNVMFNFGLFASVVSVCTACFVHSVLYFGLMVPLV